jgi:hypothetical protein
MNAIEFRPIAADIQARWFAFPIPRHALAQYVADLRDLRADHVAVAVASLNDGRDRPPTSGQIRRRVVELQLDVPAWPEARAAIVHWRAGSERRAERIEGWQCPARSCDGSGFVIDNSAARDCECRPLRLAVVRGLDELPALVAEFVGDDGYLANHEADALLEGDTTLDAQVRARWEQFARRIVDSRMLAPLPSGDDGLPRIAAARDETRRREHHGELRRVDPVALLKTGS